MRENPFYSNERVFHPWNGEWHEPGWYFDDEVCDWHGPYTSKEEAQIALDNYVVRLNGEPAT